MFSGDIMQNSSESSSRTEMSGEPIGLGIRIFDEIQRKRLEQTVKMYNKLKGKIWKVVPASEAQVVIFSVDEPGGEIFLKFAMKNLKVLPVVYAKNNKSDCPWFIDQAGGSLSCMNTLSEIYNVLSSQQKSEKEIKPPTKRNGIERFVKSVQEEDYLHISYKSLLSLYINSKTKEICIEKPQLASIALDKLSKVFDTIGTANLEIKKTSLKDFDKSKKLCSLSGVPLDSFMWEISINDSNNKLLDKIKSTKFKLDRWPNFTRLSHKYEHVVIAAFFRRFAADIVTAASKTGSSVDDITKFLNASYLLGIKVEADNDVVGFSGDMNLNPKAPKTFMQKVLDKIFTEAIT